MDVHLDPAIRNYVLFPVIFVVFVSNIIRMNLSIMFRGESPKHDSEKENMESILVRSRALRSGGNFLTKDRFEARRKLFIHKGHPSTALTDASSTHPKMLSKRKPSKPSNRKLSKSGEVLQRRDVMGEDGFLWKVSDAVDPFEAMLKQQSDMGMMTGMLKSQFLLIAIHGTLGYWITHMFSGFLVAKTPFPLTHKMKAMLQRGVDVPLLNNSYISALSLYFLISFGTGGLLQVYRMMADSTDIPDDDLSGVSQMVAPPMTGTGTDYNAAFKQERENLEVYRYQYALDDIEKSLLDLWEDRSKLTIQ